MPCDSQVETEAPKDWLRARPEMDAGRARALAHELFGVDGSVSEFGSQQDRNFTITPESGRGLLFKINHSSVTTSEIELQIAISDLLRAHGVATPEILSSHTGARYVIVEDDGGKRSQACAFELVAGEALSASEGLSGARCEELGRLAGVAATALGGMDPAIAERDIQWELGRALAVVEELIDDLPGDQRRVCLDVSRAAAAELDRLRTELPRQVIHGDVTTDNVIIDTASSLWLVDLGDAATSWRVAELAVLAADVFQTTDSIAAVGRAVRGFCAEVDLNDSELQAIWPLVILRGAVLTVSAWSQLRIDADNSYVAGAVDAQWHMFERAAALDLKQMAAQFRLSAGRAHRAGTSYSPLMPQWDSAQVVDFGVRSPLLDRGRWTEQGIERDLMRTALAAAPVAVARFGEARLTRVSQKVSGISATRARCVELRARPGTAVHAPFGGVIDLIDGGVELTDLGVTLRFEGIAPVIFPGTVVQSGDLLGRLDAEASGIGLLVVTRRIIDAPAECRFAMPDDEYEVEGAADPSTVLGLSSVPDPTMMLHLQRARRDNSMSGASERYYAEPPQIERGWGTRLVDTQGRAYLDMVNNVTAIGHSHPRFADAVARQLHLLNTNSRFLYEAYADFTEKLLQYSPDPSLDMAIPVNSGSEAVDLAIRLAQVSTGRRHVITTRESYHGWTIGAHSVSSTGVVDPASSLPEWVHVVDAPNGYRGPHRGPDAGAAYARQVEELAEKLEHSGGVAAFICEPVLGNSGGIVPPAGYLDAAYKAVRARGGLVIADEVQVGYGRLGVAFWGCSMQNAVPDIIAAAKAAGNAFPVGAVVTRRAIVEAVAASGQEFFSSAGGSPASAIAGAAVLDIIRSEGLQQNALLVGQHIKKRVEALSEKHAMIGAVHGSGLYLGIELVRDRETLEPAAEETDWICERLLALGIIMQATSERLNVLKVKPPLTLTITEADEFVDALDVALADYTDRHPRA